MDARGFANWRPVPRDTRRPDDEVVGRRAESAETGSLRSRRENSPRPRARLPGWIARGRWREPHQLRPTIDGALGGGVPERERSPRAATPWNQPLPFYTAGR